MKIGQRWLVELRWKKYAGIELANGMRQTPLLGLVVYGRLGEDHRALVLYVGKLMLTVGKAW